MHTTHSQPTMVRETRHLWVGNLPENIREDRVTEHFKRYEHPLYPLPLKATVFLSRGCTITAINVLAPLHYASTLYDSPQREDHCF